MATSTGVIQGYTGFAAVDHTHHIIVEARAHGTGSEHEPLLPVVQATRPWRLSHTEITADAGYHSEANLRELASAHVQALIADSDMRRRDERFATQERYTALPDPLHARLACSDDAAGVPSMQDQGVISRSLGKYVRKRRASRVSSVYPRMAAWAPT